MRRIICILLLISMLFLNDLMNVKAQDSTATTSAISTTPATLEDVNIKQLKEKVASKVTEMRKKDQKAVSGTIKSIKDDLVIISGIESFENLTYQIKVDTSLTQIFSVSTGVKKEMKFNDLKINNYIIASGPLLDKTIQANSIYLDDQYIVKSGKIIEVNKSGFYIIVMTAEKTEYTLDIESTTKQYMLNIKTLEIEKTGFSKVKEGDSIHFVGVLTEGKDVNAKIKMTAKKYTIIPQEYFIK